MPIDFDDARWVALKTNCRKWWAGDLERPLVNLVLGGRDPGRPQPSAPLLSQETCADLSIPAEALIDRIDYELSKNTYLGDSFPYFNMHAFGPGVIAAFLGGVLDNTTGRVWFHAPDERPIEDIHFKFDPDNQWFQRIRDIYAAGMDRWQGQVLMGMTDLGGNLDILSSFRPSEQLLLDLYDYPEEVKRLVWEAHEAWHQYFNALNEVLQPVNPGYTHWAGIYSETPTYILQCDFCYMIGPEMFEEFVKPELDASCRRLSTSFYHLDGKGQLPHLDSLLTIPSLDGVQWVPGAGQPGCSNWPEVYQKIAAAGKKMQVLGGFDELRAVTQQVGTGKGIHVPWAGAADEQSARKLLSEVGIE